MFEHAEKLATEFEDAAATIKELLRRAKEEPVLNDVTVASAIDENLVDVYEVIKLLSPRSVLRVAESDEVRDAIRSDDEFVNELIEDEELLDRINPGAMVAALARRNDNIVAVLVAALARRNDNIVAVLRRDPDIWAKVVIAIADDLRSTILPKE